MPSLSRRVVVTGVGVVSPIGTTLPAFWSALLAGRPGIGRPPLVADTPLPSRIGGAVTDYDPTPLVDRKDRKRLAQMSPEFRFAVGAAAMAAADAGLAPGAGDPDRFGVVFGAGSQSATLEDLAPGAAAAYDPAARRLDLRLWGERGLDTVPPMWLLNYVPNMGAGHVAVLLDARGPNNAVTQGDAAGVLTVAEAARLVRDGRADVILAGAADAKLGYGHSVRFNLMRPASRRNDDPAGACRPFDRTRDGTVLAEGGAFLVLEEAGRAAARGAAVYAEVAGTAAGFDPGRSGRGLARVIRGALAAAGVGPADLDHVNAHGGGDPELDAWEAGAIASAAPGVPVLAVKAYTGDTGAAGGVIELAASLLALRHGTVPGTPTHTAAGPDCPVTVPREPRPLRGGAVVKVGYSPLGQCGAVVVRRWAGGAS